MNYNVQVVPNQAQAANGPLYPIHQPIHPYLNFVPASPPYVIAFGHDKRLIPHIPLLCGLLASQIQTTATNSGLRMYLYNHTAGNNFANPNFAEVAELAAKLTVYSVNRSNNSHSSWEEHITQAVNDAILYALAICYRNDPGLQAAVNLPASDVQDIQNLLGNFNNLQEHLKRMFPSEQGNNSMYPVNPQMPANMVPNMIPMQQHQQPMMSAPMMMPNQGMMMSNQNMQQMIQTPYGVMSQQQWLNLQQQQMQQQFQQPVYQGQPGMMMPNQGMMHQPMYQHQQQQQYHPTQTQLMAPPAPQMPQNHDNSPYYGRRFTSPKTGNVSMAPAQQPAPPAPLYQDKSQQQQTQQQTANADPNVIPGYGRKRHTTVSSMPTQQQINDHYQSQPVQPEPVTQTREYRPTEVPGGRNVPKAMPVQARAPITGGDLPPAVDLNQLVVPVPSPMPEGGWVSEDQLHLYVPFKRGDRTYVWKPTVEQPYRPWIQPWSQKLYYRIDRTTGRVWYAIVEMTEEEKMDYAKHNPNADGKALEHIATAIKNGPVEPIRTVVKVHRDPALEGSGHEPEDLTEGGQAEPADRTEVSLPEFSHIHLKKEEQTVVTDCVESNFPSHETRLIMLLNESGQQPDAFTTNHQVVDQTIVGDCNRTERFLRGLLASTTMYQIGAHITTFMEKATEEREQFPGVYCLVNKIDRVMAKAYQDRIVYGLSVEGLQVKSMVNVVDDIEKAIEEHYGEAFVEALNKDVRDWVRSIITITDGQGREYLLNALLNEAEDPTFKPDEDLVNKMEFFMINSRLTTLKVASSVLGLGDTGIGETVTVQANTQMEALARGLFSDKTDKPGETQWVITADGLHFRIYKGLLGDDFYVLVRER